MGTTFSNTGNNERRDDPETVFMVPGHLTLTMRQMDVILQAGQQPGVPFRLGAAGAQRPQGNRVKVNYAENLISMRKNSLKLSEMEKDTERPDPTIKGKDDRKRKGGRKKYEALPSYSVSFSYDSLVPAVVRIFIGATDRTTTQHLRAEGASLVLGPFNLEEGKNRHWSSTLEDCYIEGKYLTSRSGAAVGPGRNSSTAFGSVPMPVETTGPTGNRILARPADVFELMVCLAPTAMAAKSSLFSSVSSQREGYTQNQVQSQQRPNDQKSAQLSEPPSTGVHTGAANGRSSSSDWSNRLPPGSSNDSAGITPFFDRESAQSLDGKVRKKPTTPETAVSSLKSTAVSVLSGEVKHTGKTQSRHIAIHTADINLKPDFTGSSNVICEVSYARVLAQKKKEVIKPIESDQNLAAISCQYNVIDGELTEQTDEVDKALEVKCVMQRVQLATGVFFTQDIYGMDRNRIEEDPVAATDDEDVTGEGDGEAVPNAPAASTPAGITLDSDAIECVICLTDNRTIAVYPCRHMCLCASCAEVLPSQGNKCPICRRAASMLIQISPKEGCEDGVQTQTERCAYSATSKYEGQIRHILSETLRQDTEREVWR